MANGMAKLVRGARWVDATEARRFLVLFALTLFIRAEAFAQSAVDWDESVYVLMARSLLSGHAPYTAVWDHKPPGIYFLFALVEGAGGSVMSVRLFTCLALAASAWAVMSIWRTLFGRASTRGWMAALMFLGLAQRYGGNTTNTEHFFVAFVALGFAVLFPILPLVSTEPRPATFGRSLLGGVLWGVALQVKFVILVDVAFFMGLLWWVTGRARRDARPLAAPTLRAPWSGPGGGEPSPVPQSLIPRVTPTATAAVIPVGLPVALGLALPTLAVVLFFWRHGALHEYVDANFLANLRHANDRTKLRGTLDFVALIINSAPFLWGLALIAAPTLHFARAAPALRLRANLLSAWLLMTSAAVLAPGQPYLHYALQTAVPGALLAAFALDAVILSQLASRLHRVGVVGVALFAVYGADVCAWGVTQMNLVSRVVHIGPPHPDVVATVAAYLRPRLVADDRLIYVVDWQPILYELTDARWPTRYLFPPFLADPHFVRVAATNPGREVASIVAERPVYVIRRQSPEARYAAFRQLADGILTSAGYRVETVIEGVELLHRPASPPP